MEKKKKTLIRCLKFFDFNLFFGCGQTEKERIMNLWLYFLFIYWNNNKITNAISHKSRKMCHINSNFFLLSILCHLFNAGLQGQQHQERSPDLHFPSHLLQFVQGNTKVFPGKNKDVIFPAYSPSTLGPPPQDMPRTPCPREAQKAS